jgi:hypothetical protein
MAYNEELADRVREALSSTKKPVEKKMPACRQTGLVVLPFW